MTMSDVVVRDYKSSYDTIKGGTCRGPLYTKRVTFLKTELSGRSIIPGDYVIIIKYVEKSFTPRVPT